MSAMISGTISVLLIFFQLTFSEIFCCTISANVNCYQTCRWWQCCFQQDSTLAHRPCNTVKLQGHELSTTLLLIMAFNLTARQWSPLIMKYRDSHFSMSVSCKSTRLNKSSGDRLKSCEVRYNIGVRRCNFCVSVHKVVLNQWACCVTGSVQLTCCEYEWMCVCVMQAAAWRPAVQVHQRDERLAVPLVCAQPGHRKTRILWGLFSLSVELPPVL